jgi:hypothetical protein
VSDPRTALLSAIYEALVGDADLLAMLGRPAIHDRVPRGAAPPFVAFTAFDTRTADGDEPPLSEHRIGIDVVSRGYGRREASQIAHRIREILHDAALDLSGHRLVQLLHVRTRIGPERDRRSFRAAITFRGLTEPN